MNTADLNRQRLTRPAKRISAGPNAGGVQDQQDQQDQKYPDRDINATAHTGEPSRSFKMQFQYEEAARYRSQDMREYAERVRLMKEVRLADRMRRQSESSARRARRALASVILGD